MFHLNDQITPVWSKWLNQWVNPTHQMTRDTVQGEGGGRGRRSWSCWALLTSLPGQFAQNDKCLGGHKSKQRLSPHHHVMRVNRIISNFLLLWSSLFDLIKDGIPYNIAIQQHVCSNIHTTYQHLDKLVTVVHSSNLPCEMSYS